MVTFSPAAVAAVASNSTDLDKVGYLLFLKLPSLYSAPEEKDLSLLVDQIAKV